MKLETELVKWVAFRDRLIARRNELRTELAEIETALSPIAPTQPSSIRRPRHHIASTSTRVETYLREHPGVTCRDIASGLEIEINKVNNPLLYMLRRDFVTRRRDDGQPWRWYLAPGVDPAPAALPNTEKTE